MNIMGAFAFLANLLAELRFEIQYLSTAVLSSCRTLQKRL